MDKNVGNVDIDELKKAREELDRERGIETDPNMYSNYNPNRDDEDASQPVATEADDAMFENSQKLEEEMINAADVSENDLFDDVQKTEEIPENSADITSISLGEETSVETESVDDDFTLKIDINPEENTAEINEISSDSANELTINDDVKEIVEIEQTQEDISQQEISEEQKQIMDETSGEVDFSVYDSFADFEVAANNNIVAEEKLAPDTFEESTEVSSEETDDTANNELENSNELMVETENDEPVDEEISSESAESSIDAVNYLDDEPVISIEPKETDDVEVGEIEIPNEDAENVDEDNDFENVSMENTISAEKNEETADDISQDEEKSEEPEEDSQNIEENIESSGEESEISKLEAQIAELKAKLKATEEDENEQVEDDKQTAENYASDAEDDYDAINSLMDSLEGLKPVDLTEEEKHEIDEKRREAEERKKDEELQIIDDFKKLERLDRILSEDMEEEQPEVAPPAPKISYPEIEPVNFVDIISTEEFKSTDNLSYILGKDEIGKIHYGNLRDFYNMVIYSKDNNSALSAVHSVLVSLILKNSTNDINFVICDSKADSKLQVYNKSSYMYFNRLAKTNKEILDTLIEISKELEERYKILAAAGVKSIEQYNVIAKNDGLKQLPYILTVFNNYSKSMQLAESDKINTILYQILKLGRIVGLYLIVVGNMKIKSDDINYNLPTRLSFAMSDEDDSLSMLGVGGAEALETDDEFLLSSLDSQTPVHLKVPSVSIKELEVLIKNIEG